MLFDKNELLAQNVLVRLPRIQLSLPTLERQTKQTTRPQPGHVRELGPASSGQKIEERTPLWATLLCPQSPADLIKQQSSVFNKVKSAIEAFDRYLRLVKHECSQLDKREKALSKAVERSEKFLDSHQAPSFILVLGPSGTGKTSIVRLAAKVLNKRVVQFDVFDPKEGLGPQKELVLEELNKRTAVLIVVKNLSICKADVRWLLDQRAANPVVVVDNEYPLRWPAATSVVVHAYPVTFSEQATGSDLGKEEQSLGALARRLMERTNLDKDKPSLQKWLRLELMSNNGNFGKTLTNLQLSLSPSTNSNFLRPPQPPRPILPCSLGDLFGFLFYGSMRRTLRSSVAMATQLAARFDVPELQRFLRLNSLANTTEPELEHVIQVFDALGDADISTTRGGVCSSFLEMRAESLFLVRALCLVGLNLSLKRKDRYLKTTYKEPFNTDRDDLKFSRKDRTGNFVDDYLRAQLERQLLGAVASPVQTNQTNLTNRPSQPTAVVGHTVVETWQEEFYGF